MVSHGMAPYSCILVALREEGEGPGSHAPTLIFRCHKTPCAT